MNNHIKIDIISKYIPERSSPAKSYYFFSYHVTIKNQGDLSTQLISRYWHITDGNGNTEDIHGPGVVGQTPVILPGQSFEYTSFCPLPTPIGFMEGSYRFKEQSGKEFDVIIDRFRLIAPGSMN